MIDLAATVRPGEELPVEQLTAYLQQHLHEPTGLVTVRTISARALEPHLSLTIADRRVCFAPGRLGQLCGL